MFGEVFIFLNVFIFLPHKLSKCARGSSFGFFLCVDHFACRGALFLHPPQLTRARMLS